MAPRTRSQLRYATTLRPDKYDAGCWVETTGGDAIELANVPLNLLNDGVPTTIITFCWIKGNLGDNRALQLLQFVAEWDISVFIVYKGHSS